MIFHTTMMQFLPYGGFFLVCWPFFDSFYNFNNKLKEKNNKTLELDLIFRLLLSVSIYFPLNYIHFWSMHCTILPFLHLFTTYVIFLYVFLCCFSLFFNIIRTFFCEAFVTHFVRWWWSKKNIILFFYTKKKLSLQFPWLFSTNFATISGYAMGQICHRYVKLH